MKSVHLFLFALFACFAIKSSADPANNPAQYPAPPMQGKPWTPPKTKLPPLVVSAVKELFDQGMSDPRGCEYREVEIASAVPSDEKTTIKVHAWVLPGDGKTRFCVAWNGLEYPVTAVGAPADIRKDIEPGPPDIRNSFDMRWGEYDYNTISEKRVTPVKAAMLLRIGEAGLAEQLWNEGWQVWTGIWATDADSAKSDPYADMAQDWLDAWYRRALAAHMEGNDAVALQLFRSLQPVAGKVKASAARRKLPAISGNGSAYLAEIRQLPELIADQERRAKEPPRQPIALTGTLSSGPAYIAALVKDLEFVQGHEFMSPGDNTPFNDATVLALIRQGEPAVEPLIASLEEDPPRMTRNIYSYRERFQGPVDYVYDPAYIALGSILKITITIPLPKDTNRRELSLDDRKLLAAKFRAWWARYKGMTPNERWYAILQDDNAKPGEWFNAVSNIVQPMDEVSYGPDLFGGGGGSEGDMQNATMIGEPLRAKTNPSVSNLIIKRFDQLLPLAKVNDNNTWIRAADSAADTEVSYEKISNLLLQFADWDGKARPADLKRMTKELNDRFPAVGEGFTSPVEVNEKLLEKREALGDPDALHDYVAKVLAMPPKTALSPAVLSIMEQHPNDPNIRSLAEKMFLDKKSLWRPNTPPELRAFAYLVKTRLLGLPAFREEVLEILDDKSVMGFTRTLENGELDVRMNDERDDYQKERAALPKTGFRVCDYYASVLEGVCEFPRFQVVWPQAQRDAAIADYKQFLKQYGDDYQPRPNAPPDGGWPEIEISFPQLGRPATADDVAQGRAIFALTGETRLCPVPKFPQYAKRSGSNKGWDETEKTLDRTESRIAGDETTGRVWQAEEVKVNGKWERFYGFAGRHQLVKVPAAEIEFPGVSPGGQISPQVDGAARLQPDKQKEGFFPSLVFGATGDPLPVAIEAYNHTGLDQEVPGVFILPPNTSKTLPQGISLSLAYSERIPPDADEKHFFLGAPFIQFDYGTWKDVPMKKEIATARTVNAPVPIGPAATLTLLRFDVHDYFDISAPGTYRLRVMFHPPGGAPAAGNEITFHLQPKAPSS